MIEHVLLRRFGLRPLVVRSGKEIRRNKALECITSAFRFVALELSGVFGVDEK